MQTTNFNVLSKKMLIFIILYTYYSATSAVLANNDGTPTTNNISLDITTTTTTTAAAMVSTKNAKISPTAPPVRLPPPRVMLNKCCHYGEHLNANKQCVTGSTNSWVPNIFLINRRIFQDPKGTAPTFMSFEENMRPMLPNSSITCPDDDLEYFQGAKILIFSNGTLFLLEHKQIVEPRRFCVDLEAALVCSPQQLTIGKPRLKLRKCCGDYASYDDKLKTCVIGTQYAAKLTLPAPLGDAVPYQTIYGFPTCTEALPQHEHAYVIAGDWQAAQLNTENGQLLVASRNLSWNDYCLEHLSTDNSIKIFSCLHHFGVSQQVDESALERAELAVINVGIVISVIFLAATLVAGYMLPSAHHLLHWRCQIYYVFCLFVGCLLLAYEQLGTLELGSGPCLLVASTMHFFFLSAFFWLNTMCFNIWWTFRDFRPTSLERNQEVLRLRLYSAYAWGIPLLISTIAYFVDQLPETSLLQPGFGLRACWFNGEHLAIFAYFFGPVGILLSINIVLFISTTHMLTCGLWKRDDIKSTTEKTALGKVCLKLVVVMGVTWISEIISWLVGGPNSRWFITDLINALQGVFIFLVVGCQPQVWTAIKRCCWSRSRQEITNTTNGVQHSSSSQGPPSLAACGGELTQNTSMNVTTTATDNESALNSSNQTKIPMETVC